MKLLDIQVFYEKKLIGSASSSTLTVIPFLNASYFTFENYIGIKEIEIPLTGYEKLDVSIFCFDIHKEKFLLIDLEIYLVDTITTPVKGEFKVQGLIVSKWKTDIYNQKIINVFKLWELNKEFDWKDNNCTKEDKDAYCRACLVWSKTPKYLPLNSPNIIEINGRNIKDWYDFYILLGEKILGERKLFALGLDSLEDVLIDLHHHFINRKTMLVLKNVHIITNILGEKYLDSMESILKKSNIKIIKK